MARNGVAAMVLLLAALCGCGEDRRSEPPAAAVAIPADQIEAVKQKASQGDLDSTRRLVEHFSSARPDEGELIRWLRVGVSQNDLASKLELATRLAKRGTREDCIEAESILTTVIARANVRRERLRAEWKLDFIRKNEKGVGCLGLLPPAQD